MGLKPDAMKNFLLLLATIILFASCESENEPDNNELNNDPSGAEIVMIIDDFISFDYDEIHLYDSSSHVLIFKDIHPEFEKLKNVTFDMCAKGNVVYRGYFWPTYLSSLPDGPYISNNPMDLQNYALRIDFMSINNKPDPRNDQRFINALRDHDLLHSGLSLRIGKVESNGSLISFSFSITNMDRSELLVMDPDAMGLNLFHYFTNGLVLRNLSTGAVTTATIAPKTPVPLNGFRNEWLSRISPAATKSYTFLYTPGTRLMPGEYSVSFTYPGLTYQVDIMNLYQEGTRVWLGSVTSQARLTIQ